LNNWQILDIEPGSDGTVIKSAFRKKALKVHPDVSGYDSAKDFKELYEAFEYCLREAGPDLEINLNEIFAGTGLSHLAEIFRAMNINSYMNSFSIDSLIGMKVRFTFDPKDGRTHEHTERDRLEEGRE